VAYEPLNDDEIRTMTMPLWDEAKQAMADGDLEWAAELLDQAVERWRSLQDYSINWITSLLSFIGSELGEDAVEQALRHFGDEFIRARRDTGVDWAALPAAARAKAVARSMVANFSECDVSEDDEKITLAFRCGSGGRLMEQGRYDGDNGYLVLGERAPRTFDRDELPVYCAHCSVNNQMQAVEWTGRPMTVEAPPTESGGRCIHHVYRDMDAIPDEVYRRIGKEKPGT
jgi:hypothetical protein